MRGAKKLSDSVRNSAASARSLIRSHEQDDANTQKYLQVIASLHKEWDELEAQGSSSVMPRRSLMDAIAAETRHGSQVEMPVQHVRVFIAGTDSKDHRCRARRTGIAFVYDARPHEQGAPRPRGS